MPLKIIKTAGGLNQITYGITNPLSDPPNQPIIEVGINISRFQVRYYPEVNERFKDEYGSTMIRSVSQHFSREVSLEGEFVGGASGVMALTLGTSATFANGSPEFLPCGIGALYVDDITVNRRRRGWKTISARLSGNPFLGAAP